MDYLLFVDEELLTEKVAGMRASWNASAPPGRGPSRPIAARTGYDDAHDAYPCSYMIYSAAFDGLPTVVRDAIYRCLWQVLSGQDAAPRYARLSGEDRRAIIEILRETKQDLPHDILRPAGPSPAK